MSEPAPRTHRPGSAFESAFESAFKSAIESAFDPAREPPVEPAVEPTSEPASERSGERSAECPTQPSTGRSATRRSAGRLALRPVPAPDTIPAKRCPVGHPNDPEATSCRLCRDPIDAAVSVVELAPRPLGRLLLEDGTAVDLVTDLLIGRCPPEAGPAVETLAVAGRQVSRLHLAVEVRGWRLLVIDRGSTNGTFVTRRGERGRRRIAEDRSSPLAIGDTLHFGARQALVVAPAD